MQLKYRSFHVMERARMTVKCTKMKEEHVSLRPFYSVLLFCFSFVILNFIIMRTKNLHGINNKSNDVGVVALITRRPYCPGRRKSFVLPRLTPMVSTARLGVVKQSFSGLPGQYGRRVTRAN